MRKKEEISKSLPADIIVSILYPTPPNESNQTSATKSDINFPSEKVVPIRINSNSVLSVGDSVKKDIESHSFQKDIAKKTDIEVRKDKTDKQAKKRVRLKTEYVVAIIGAVATIVAGILSSPLIEKWFSPVPVATEKATVAFTSTSQPIIPSQTIESTFVSATSSVTLTPIESFTPKATPLPTEITDAKGVTMRLVPAGEFTMGSDDGNSDEKPAHQVYLDAFYMDIYEVTNVLYKSCVEAGSCNPPKDTSRYNTADYENHPVVSVDWNQAQTYCEWRGGGLPTEEQWEKAARGTDERTYPWGEGISCNQANYYDGSKYFVRDTTEVGSYESGKSPYGMYDMAGNAWEWVSDWYDAYP